MSPPPAARPETQSARGGDARGRQQTGGNRAYVRVSNPVWNGRPVMRRKDAKHYVSTGRAVWLGDDCEQIRLLALHPQNRAVSIEASAGYNRAAAVMIRRPEELRHLPVLLADIALTDRSEPVRHHFTGRSGPVRTKGAEVAPRIGATDTGSDESIIGC
jgi:hypothetical protein